MISEGEVSKILKLHVLRYAGGQTFDYILYVGSLNSTKFLRLWWGWMDLYMLIMKKTQYLYKISSHLRTVFNDSVHFLWAARGVSG